MYNLVQNVKIFQIFPHPKMACLSHEYISSEYKTEANILFVCVHWRGLHPTKGFFNLKLQMFKNVANIVTIFLLH